MFHVFQRFWRFFPIWIHMAILGDSWIARCPHSSCTSTEKLTPASQKGFQYFTASVGSGFAKQSISGSSLPWDSSGWRAGRVDQTSKLDQRLKWTASFRSETVQSVFTKPCNGKSSTSTGFTVPCILRWNEELPISRVRLRESRVHNVHKGSTGAY
jgi:hypothetical protein